MRSLFACLLAAVLLAGCGTPDIGALLVQEGDLPEGFTGSEGEIIEVEHEEGVPDPAQVNKQALLGPRASKGDVRVYLFSSADEAAQVYEHRLGGFGQEGEEQHNFGTSTTEAVSGIGEQAVRGILSGSTGMRFLSVDLMFLRCRALAYIRFYDVPLDINPYAHTPFAFTPEEVLAYAGRLDARLEQAVCP